ncbi:hypothetical protein [Tenggerimyces flavus]|uniref:Glycosyltransferase RgtA/B/C/D-like domain-containing protein n=1 Tax=Tenggerimyces flavus TaxID=1708749 RepID=A0ABV7YK78_9ACTN|nr:hypothetical protein [Tenggerimyces flavus]MBM7789374.1 hypothetical protein [Tenggerimyces flavus]
MALALWARVADESAYRLIADRWDAVWYQRIAENGYGFVLHAPGVVHPDYMFSPLYPYLMRFVAAWTPLDLPAAGLVLSWLACLVAAWGVFAVGAHVGGRRVGTMLVLLWAALPIAHVQTMAYTESLFTAMAAWCLYATLTQRWLVAGLLASLAGLTRPSAPALVAAVGVAALLELVRERRFLWRPLVGAALAALGYLGWVAWVGIRTGEPLGYFHVLEQWNKSMDLGQAAVQWMLALPPWLGVAVAVSYLLVIALLVWSIARYPLPSLAVFSSSTVALALLGTGYFNSRPRLLVPAFPLLLPFADRLARARPWVPALVLGLLTLASAAYGGYSLVVGQAPP